MKTTTVDHGPSTYFQERVAGRAANPTGLQKLLWRTAVAAGVTALVAPQAAFAQSAQSPSSQPVVLAPISIDAKADVITGGTQLEAEDFDRINPETLRDIFRQEPGVEVGSPIAISQKIYVNGIEDSNLHVDIDGARQANKTYHHVGTTMVDPGLFKAVKIETGVAPTDAGPFALAGTVSLETKDGRDFVGKDEHFGGYGKLSYNNNTEGFAEDLALAARFEGFDAMVYGRHSTGRDYKDGANNRVQGTEPSMKNYLAKVGYTAPNGYRIKLSATRYDDIALRDARPNFSLPNANGRAYTDYSRQSTTLSFGDETPTDMWDPKFSVSRTVSHLDTEQYANSRSIIARVKSINGKVQNTFTTAYGKITVGGDFLYDEGTGGVTSVSHTDRKEKLQNHGAYVQNRWALTDRWRTSFGVRVDRNKLTGNNGEELTNTGLSGNANAEYDVTKNLTVYGGAGSVFGGIPMTEMGVQTADRNYDDVDPSRSYSGKVGANIRYDAFTVDAHLFKTRIDNSHDLTSATRKNAYDLVTKGGNLSVRYDYAAGFVRGTYSHTDVTVDSAIPVSGGGAEHYQGALFGDKFTIEASHTFSEWGVRIGTTNEWVLENDDTQESFGEALNGYFVSNIYAEWRPEQVPGLMLRADVKNLFDRTYTDRSNAGQYNLSVATVEPYNDPGRSLLVTAKYDF